MKTYTPFTYNGATINNANFTPTLETEGQLIPSTNIIEVERTNNFPEYAGKEFESKLLPLQVQIGTATGLIDTLNGILDTTDKTMHAFVVKDENNKQWYVNAVVQKQIDYGPNNAEYVLYAADPIWRAVDSSSAALSATASPGTVLGTVGGNRIAYPEINIIPGGAKSGGYAVKRFIEIYNPSDEIAYVSYPLNIVDNGSGTASWASSALVAGGTISSASGYDVRLVLDNTEVDRWFGNFNTGTTKVWSNISLQPKVELTLASALGTTTPDAIEFDKSTREAKKNNYNALVKLPSSGILKTAGTEYIYYSAVEPKSWKVTGITRGTRNSPIGTAAAKGTLLYIEHDAYLMYGNASAIAPDQDDNYEPAISLTDSNNISHKWAVFGEIDGLRPLQWFPSVVSTRGKESYTYGGNQGTKDTDPYTEMGMAAIGYSVGSRAQAESCVLEWNLYHPAGGTQIIYAGETYRGTNSYPKLRRIQKSNAGNKYVEVVNIGTPTNAGSWTAFAGTSALGGTYTRFKWDLYGGLSAIADNAAYAEMNDFTLNLATAKVPVVTMRAEEDNYRLDMTIENVTTGESIDIDLTMGIGQELDILCASNNAYIYDDGTPANSAITTNTARDYWLKLVPGVNQIVVTEEGLTDVGITIFWRESAL